MKEVSLNASVVSQVVSGHAVLLDLGNEEYFGLGDVGTHVWACLQQGKQPTEIVKMLMDEFDTDELTLTNDLEYLLSELESHGLITRT